MRKETKHILVANSKGGCGKTTIAINLTVALALKGGRVTLLDHDPQGSCRHWTAARSPEMEPVLVKNASAPSVEVSRLVDHETDVSIIDTARGPGMDAAFNELIKLSDVILVPMLSSALDIRAGERFITDLMTNRLFRAKPRPLGIICNRVSGDTACYQKLVHFLRCLDLPIIAQFRESPVYARAVEEGLGIMEMTNNRAARKEYSAWHKLMEWIDHAPSATTSPLPLAAGKRARAVPSAGVTPSATNQR